MSCKMGDAQIFQKMQKMSFFEETVSKKSGPLAPRGPKLLKIYNTACINSLYKSFLYLKNTQEVQQ